MQSSNVVSQTSPHSLAVIPTERRRNSPTKAYLRERLSMKRLRAEAEDTSESAAGIEGAVRAIAYLLSYASEGGNKALPSETSNGLSVLLEKVADDVKRHEQLVQFIRGTRR